MKKTEIYQNNEVIYALPPEPIDETEPVCLVDYMLPRSGERSLDYSRLRRFGEDNFKLKIGGTIYEISTHLIRKATMRYGTIQGTDPVRKADLTVTQ